MKPTSGEHLTTIDMYYRAANRQPMLTKKDITAQFAIDHLEKLRRCWRKSEKESPAITDGRFLKLCYYEKC